MNSNRSYTASRTGNGYLIVKVSTALGAIPLEGALVTIRNKEQSNSDIVYSLKSDSSGITKKISLPAPNISESESPGNIQPYSLYSIDVSKDGYLPLKINEVAIFDSITSIQPAVMIPLSDNKYADSFAKKDDTSPSDVKSIKSGGEAL